MRKLAEETWHAFRQNWKNVLLFELLYRGIMLPVYLQFADRVMQTALKAAGYRYLTADNIGDFLARPWTVLTGSFVLLVGILLTALETAGLITAFQGAAYSYKLSPLHILWGGIQKIDEEITKKNLLLAGLLILQSLLYNGVYAAALLYVIKPETVFLKKWVLFLLVAIVVITIPWIFIFHICMIEQKVWKEAVPRSRELLYKHRGKTVCHLLFCHLAVLLMVSALYGISVLILCAYQIRHTEMSCLKAAVYVGMFRLRLIWLLIGWILAAVVHYAALTAMFYEYAKRRYHAPEWKIVYPAKKTAARRRLTALLAVTAASAVFMLADLSQHGFVISEYRLLDMQITAHRGSTRNAPENTMAAVRQAAKEMADCVEIDVQMTKDGVIVLGNDASLKRVAGVNRAIPNMTLEEIRQLDAGSLFSPEFAGEPIPTLAEVLEFCRGKMHVNIEIRPARRNSAVAERVVELIQEEKMELECTVMSSSMAYLKRVKELEPKLSTGYIVTAAYGNVEPGEQADAVSIRYPFADEELVAHIHSQGKRVYAWTVNIPSEVRRLKRAGVDGVITDRPVMVREVVYQNRKAERLLRCMRQMLRQENY